MFILFPFFPPVNPFSAICRQRIPFVLRPESCIIKSARRRLGAGATRGTRADSAGGVWKGRRLFYEKRKAAKEAEAHESPAHTGAQDLCRGYGIRCCGQYPVCYRRLYVCQISGFCARRRVGPGADLQLFVGSAHRHDDPYHQHSHHHHQL